MTTPRKTPRPLPNSPIQHAERNVLSELEEQMQPGFLDPILGSQRIPLHVPSLQVSGSTPSSVSRQPGQTHSRALVPTMTTAEQARAECALRNKPSAKPDERIATQARQIADQARQIADQARQIAALTADNARLHSFISSVDFAPATVVTRSVPVVEHSPRAGFFTRFRRSNVASVPDETPHTEVPRATPRTEVPRAAPRATPRAASRTTPRAAAQSEREQEQNVYAAWVESPAQNVAPVRPPLPLPVTRPRAGTVPRRQETADVEYVEPTYMFVRRQRLQLQTSDNEEHDGIIA
jgi:hypothetical protein